MDAIELEKIEAQIRYHRRNVFDEVNGDWHTAQVRRLKKHSAIRAENRRREEHRQWLQSEALLRKWA